MRVFDIRASSFPLGYLCAKFRFCGLRCWASPWRKITYSINQSINYSLTYLAYLMPREPKLSLRESNLRWSAMVAETISYFTFTKQRTFSAIMICTVWFKNTPNYFCHYLPQNPADSHKVRRILSWINLPQSNDASKKFWGLYERGIFFKIPFLKHSDFTPFWQ